VKKALKAIQVANQSNDKDCNLPIEKFKCRLSMKAKKSKRLRLNGIPDERTYIKKILKASRRIITCIGKRMWVSVLFIGK